MFGLIDKLEKEECLEREEWITLLSACGDEKLRDYAAQKARTVAQGFFGTDIYVRGLIEFSNYCKNDCYYCGIRRSNLGADRYRLSMEDILVCCEEGWELGFRTFVLQGGEDGFYRDEWYEELIHEIKRKYPACAITLSVGERTKETYRRWYEAGGNVSGSQEGMSLCPERDRLSGGLWFYGGISGTGTGAACTGYGIYSRTEASYGRDRTFCTGSGDSLCEGDAGKS